MINYAKLFHLALMAILVLVILRWLRTGSTAMTDLLPGYHHTSFYNRTATGMLLIGAWGFARLVRQALTRRQQ